MNLVILVAVASILAGVLLLLFKDFVIRVSGNIGPKNHPLLKELYADKEGASRTLGCLAWVFIVQGVAISLGLIIFLAIVEERSPADPVGSSPGHVAE